MSSMSEATLKTGDTGRTLAATLRYDDGTVIDLTGCTVTFAMRAASAVYASVYAAADVDADPTTGRVTFDGWSSGDLDTAGSYVAEFVVTDSSGGEITVPSDGYLTVRILAGIDQDPG